MAETEWVPTHRHVKTKRLYQVIARGLDATNLHAPAPQVVIYRNEIGHWFIRDAHEFDDGRFEELPKPTATIPPTFSQGLAAGIEAADAENILLVAKAIYELEPFYMPSGEVKSGVQLARKFEWESIPSYRQIDLQRIAKTAIDAFICALTPLHTEAAGPIVTKPITIAMDPREDGGLRMWSDELPGLVLSHPDHGALFRNLPAEAQATELASAARWMRARAADLWRQVSARKQAADSMRDATASELQEAARIRFPSDTRPLKAMTVKEARQYAASNSNIADRLETEAAQLSAWADLLERLGSAPSERTVGLG